MRPAALRGALLGCLGLALLCLGDANKRLRDRHEWKKLILVQHWPETVCEEVQKDCKNPPDYWTIHGLWPDNSENCNGSWKFNLKEIQDLLPEMKEYWPDLIHLFPNRSSFWNHEWRKHGTCAAQVDALNSQRKYFGRTLELYRELDLSSVLLKLGIQPSINYYQVADFKDALARVYRVIPKIHCLPPSQDEEVQTIGQIELCLTKQDQKLQNCTEPGQEPPPEKEVWLAGGGTESQGLRVCEDGPVFYPPPKKAKH
ncbi:ribonuclease T2 [Sapajus apella]|uniref:Ribonuclease T2 n=1 Tax=Sapajus apella TaxID=9515 RepID=A0A6J3FUM5_SAPAP|nr:ribonuclease T2 [Sapajus apella]